MVKAVANPVSGLVCVNILRLDCFQARKISLYQRLDHQFSLFVALFCCIVLKASEIHAIILVLFR